MIPAPLRRIAKISGKILLMIIFIFLLLEFVVRVVWWNRSTVEILDKEITLLPLPLVSKYQSEILEQWSKQTNAYIRFDPVLGWSINPNVSQEIENQAGHAHSYTSNGIGIRSLREYDLVTPPGITRIVAFGPSFTHGDEVNDEDTWTAQIEQMRPDVEAMNWGVGGFGTDQAFLRYKTQGAAYQPEIVLIGFEENNIWRNVNHFRPFYQEQTESPLTKPVYVRNADETAANKLVLVKNPFENFDDFHHMVLLQPEQFIRTICVNDSHCDERRYQAHLLDVFTSYRFFRTLTIEMTSVRSLASEHDREQNAQQVSLLIAEMFIREVMQHQATPVFIIFPNEANMLNHEMGILPPYHLGKLSLQNSGIHVIDLADAFVRAKQTQNLDYDDFFARAFGRGHYNELGNQIVAQTVLQYLCSQQLLEKC